MRLGSETNTRNMTKCKAICLQEVCLHTRLLGFSILMKFASMFAVDLLKAEMMALAQDCR